MCLENQNQGQSDIADHQHPSSSKGTAVPSPIANLLITFLPELLLPIQPTLPPLLQNLMPVQKLSFFTVSLEGYLFFQHFTAGTSHIREVLDNIRDSNINTKLIFA